MDNNKIKKLWLRLCELNKHGNLQMDISFNDLKEFVETYYDEDYKFLAILDFKIDLENLYFSENLMVGVGMNINLEKLFE